MTRLAKRFVIEGVWSGYRSSQRRIVHRTVHKGSTKRLRAWVKKTHGIQYADGTTLYLTVRDCKPREKVKEIKGYVKLISLCQLYDVSSVHDLEEKQKVFRAQTKALREDVLDGDGSVGEIQAIPVKKEPT